LKAGLTQEELAGADITRNMLSRIENGAALPSLPTLCALAERLNIPAGALLSELSIYETNRLTTELRLLLIKKRYTLLLEHFKSAGINVTDELARILCSANTERAWELFKEGHLTEALTLLDAADKYSSMTDSDTTSISNHAMLCRILIESAINPAGDNQHKNDEKLVNIIFRNNELAIYIYARNILKGMSGRAFSVPDENAALCRQKLEPFITELPDGFIKTHILAKIDMANADYLSAKAKLVPYLDNPSKLPPSILFDFYTDLELCCKCCGDFENAYKYSSVKLALLQKIK
jgi:transcriptional regulator with XRE-family HTH domain